MTFDRSLHRFFLTETTLITQQQVDLSPLAHQLHTVLRMQSGAQILLLDGAGHAFLTEIRHLERTRASGFVLASAAAPPEPSTPLTLYQCSLKADKFEWVLQKGTELGVARFVPVISARSIVRPAAALRKKYSRWCAILREAAEQCGRGCVPTLLEPLTWQEAIAHATGLRLMPWEETADGPQQGLGHALQSHCEQHTHHASINLLIGPEGGISADEAAAARAAGWQTVSLGPRILRAETAALASVTVVMERLGELR